MYRVAVFKQKLNLLKTKDNKNDIRIYSTDIGFEPIQT